jgi:hypothetical protein
MNDSRRRPFRKGMRGTYVGPRASTAMDADRMIGETMRTQKMTTEAVLGARIWELLMASNVPKDKQIQVLEDLINDIKTAKG